MTTATLVAPDVEQIIELHRGQLKRREYTPLGILSQIMLEPSTPADPRALPLKQIQSTILDWYKKSGPLLALAQDAREILVVSPMIPAPPIPDPTWRHSGKTGKDGYLRREKPPLVGQNMLDRASGIIESKEGDWLVFQPLQQIMFKAQMSPSWGIVACSANSEGRHTALLYQPRTQEAHFCFGRKDLRIF